MKLCEVIDGMCRHCGRRGGAGLRRRCKPRLPEVYTVTGDEPIPAMNLAVVTAMFNPVDHRVYRDNWRIWRAAMQPLLDSGRISHCVTVQAAWPGQERFGDLVIDAGERNIAWQKERLLMIGIESLPSEVDAVALVDGDVLFCNPHWPEDIKRGLSRVRILHCFQEIMRNTGPRESCTRYGSSLLTGKTQTPGGAFAGRRDCLTLYQHSPLGGGDLHTLWAWIRRNPCGNHAGLIHESHWRRWAAGAFARVEGHVGVVRGAACHLYHGSKENRSYTARRDWLREARFDPESDIRIGVNGLLEWTRDDLLAIAKAHFSRRVEGLP